jgi:hypothetical protein
MTDKTRGFKKLKGKTIKDVRTNAINEVEILCEDGTYFTIDGDTGPFGLPVISLDKKKGTHTNLPEPPQTTSDSIWQWPYPPEKE